MDDLPTNIAEARANFQNVVKAIERTRSAVLQLTDDISNRDSIRVKIRTHQRQMNSYNKQVEKYWALIEEDAKYAALQDEYFDLVESVDAAELDLNEQLTSFNKSFDASKQSETSTSRPPVDPIQTLLNAAITTSTSAPLTTGTTPFVNLSSVSSMNTVVPTTVIPSSAITPQVALPPILPGGVPSSGNVSLHQSRPITTPFVQPTMASSSSAGIHPSASSVGNITQVQRTAERSEAVSVWHHSCGKFN